MITNKEKYKILYNGAFGKVGTPKTRSLDSLSTGVAMLGATAGLTGLLLGGLNKMFGQQEQIPKGVVKELMHGIMAGVQDMIAEKDYDIKDLKEKLERNENDLKEVKEERDAIQRRYDELMNFAEDMKAKQKEKAKTTRKKPGPKPGSKKKKK